MSMWRHVTRGLRVLVNRDAADRDLDDELRHFVEMAEADYRSRGLSPDDARRAARRDAGCSVRVREDVRAGGWERVVEASLADVRFATRMLRKSPVFTLVVVAVIALGSGAVTTIFSAINAILLRPIPGVQADASLVTLRPTRADGSVAEQASYDYYTYLRDRARTVDGIAAWGKVNLTIAARGDASIVFGHIVSGNYFDVLRMRPSLGRLFDAGEGRAPLADPVVVVSHAFWREHLGGRSDVVGEVVHVNGHPYTLIGVAAPEFHGLYTGMRVDAWVPLTMQPQLRPRVSLASGSWLWLSGRLADGASVAAAQTELASLSEARLRESGRPATATSWRSISVTPLTGLPGGESRALFGFMSLLLLAAILVLTIAGVNVAAMLAARYTARRREMAVRAALGAGRMRLLRQLLVEVLALFVAGSLGGFAFATAATSALERLPLPETIPIHLELSPDLRVLGFAVGICIVAGLAFGLAPAMQAARRDIAARLRSDAAGAPRPQLIGRALVAGQLALSLVLIVAAGLFLRALDRGQHIDPGFEVQGIALATLEPESWGYGDERTRAFYDRLLERVVALPGVTAAAYTGRIPLMMSSSVDDMTADDGRELSVHMAAIGPAYFDVLRLPLAEGRVFEPADAAGTAPVAVVNQTLARLLAPSGSALGRTVRFRDVPVTIVGVARDAKYATLDEPTPPFLYVPVAQVWQPGQTLLVRSATDPSAVSRALQDAVLSLDPLLPRPRVTTLERATAIVLLPQRVAAMVTGALGAAGLLLAAVGLYGLMSYNAGRRTREIGIRLALGARRRDVLVMMVRDGMWLAAAGVIGGLALAAAAARLIGAWMFDVNPYDPATFAAMSALFLAVALAASYLPARRAAAADPMTALRTD